MKFTTVEIKIDPRALNIIEENYGSLQKYLNNSVERYTGDLNLLVKVPTPPKKKINTAQVLKAKRILKKFIKMLGNGYHPDNHFGDYVNRDNRPSFTDKQILKYDKERRFVWKILGEDQIYKTLKEIEGKKK